MYHVGKRRWILPVASAVLNSQMMAAFVSHDPDLGL